MKRVDELANAEFDKQFPRGTAEKRNDVAHSIAMHFYWAAYRQAIEDALELLVGEGYYFGIDELPDQELTSEAKLPNGSSISFYTKSPKDPLKGT